MYKTFELRLFFMHKFLCQNIQKFPLHILRAKRINTFCSKGINKFGLELSALLQPKISHKKNQKYSHRILELYRLLICNFFMPNCINISIVHTTQNTWLTQFCIITHHLVIYYDLTYTCLNLISWSNLSYKNQQNCVDNSNFLRTLKIAKILLIYHYLL